EDDQGDRCVPGHGVAVALERTELERAEPGGGTVPGHDQEQQELEDAEPRHELGTEREAVEEVHGRRLSVLTRFDVRPRARRPAARRGDGPPLASARCPRLVSLCSLRAAEPYSTPYCAMGSPSRSSSPTDPAGRSRWRGPTACRPSWSSAPSG